MPDTKHTSVGRLLLTMIFLMYSTYFIFAQSPELSLYSFRTRKGEKVELAMASDSSYLLLRIVRPGKPEEIHKEIKKGDFKLFTYSSYLRGGGLKNSGLDLNSVNIKEGDLLFQLSQNSEGNKPFEAELKITNLKSGEEINLKGEANSVKGSLLIFRDNELLQRSTD